MVTVSDVKGHTHPNQAPFHTQCIFMHWAEHCAPVWVAKLLEMSQLSVHSRGVNWVNNVHSLIHSCIAAGWAAWAGFVNGGKKKKKEGKY